METEYELECSDDGVLCLTTRTRVGRICDVDPADLPAEVRDSFAMYLDQERDAAGHGEEAAAAYDSSRGSFGRLAR